MNPLEVRADEACCEMCGRGGEDVALSPLGPDGLVLCRSCAAMESVWRTLMAPRAVA